MGFEVWGNGKQTRSFCYVDDCVEGILRITHSDYTKPLNLGSDVAISMNGMAKLCMKLAKNELPIRTFLVLKVYVVATVTTPSSRKSLDGLQASLSKMDLDAPLSGSRSRLRSFLNKKGLS